MQDKTTECDEVSDWIAMGNGHYTTKDEVIKSGLAIRLSTNQINTILGLVLDTYPSIERRKILHAAGITDLCPHPDLP